MTGETLNYKRRLEIPFGQYFKIHEEDNPCNNTKPRIRGEIFMGTSRNKQGVFNFMTLGYMKKVVRQSWDTTPMPDTVIAQVNAIEREQINDLDFLDIKKLPIGYLEITGVDAGETEAQNIDLIEPETDIDPISAGA